jgi:hypothetical protein
MKQLIHESEFELGMYYLEYSKRPEMIGISLFLFNDLPTSIDDGSLTIIWRYGLSISQFHTKLDYDTLHLQQEPISQFSARTFFTCGGNEYWVLSKDEALDILTNIL